MLIRQDVLPSRESHSRQEPRQKGQSPSAVAVAGGGCGKGGRRVGTTAEAAEAEEAAATAGPKALA